MRMGESKTMSELEDFRALFCTDGRREIEMHWYQKLAALPLEFELFRAACVKAQLSCPDECLVKKVCRFIPGADLDACHSGKPKNKDATACEAALHAFRTSNHDMLAALGLKDSVRILTKLDTQCARIVLGKKCTVHGPRKNI